MALYKKLRGQMYANDIGRQELALSIGHNTAYISKRMTGKYPWNLDEVYAICDLLDIPLSEIPKYFPKGGVSV